MQITLKSMRINNFKGIEHLDVEFNPYSTAIWGDNATGKTSILDAFLWLFFGKNSTGVSQFEIKRLDQNNQFIKDLVAEVQATVEVNNITTVVRKELRQKWVRRRGDDIAKYNGDENVYFWNDVPLKESEFKVKIAGIIDENLFRMITNPFHFNTLKWQERRNVLLQMAGDISTGEIISALNAEGKADYSKLIEAINAGKSIEEYKSQIAIKKKQLKDELDLLPGRIDEVRRSIITDINFEDLRHQIEALETERQIITSKLNDILQAEREANESRQSELQAINNTMNANKQEQFRLKSSIQQLEFNAKQLSEEKPNKIRAAISAKKRSISDHETNIANYKNAIEQIDQSILTANSRLDQLREKYHQVDESVLEFNDHEFTCPTCRQNLPAELVDQKKETLTENFNSNKLQELNKIVADADRIKSDLAALETRKNNGNESISNTVNLKNDLELEVKNLESELLTPTQGWEAFLTKEYTDQQQQLQELVLAEQTIQRSLDRFNSASENTATDPGQKNFLNDQSRSITDKIIALNRDLAQEDVIKKQNDRLSELVERQDVLVNEIVELEGIEFSIMEFTKAKSNVIEQRTNGLFNHVKFKLFDQQVNGGETPCCETLINSNGSFVPFSDANNAARINAGLDIINALCRHYNVYAPIFIDNSESVTKLIDCGSQLVRLVVSEPDKKLRVA